MIDYSNILPSEPILPVPPPALAQLRSGGYRWMQQARRRALIFAAARQLVTEDGYDHVSIRRLAERSGVTPPTIYNLIGGRGEVLHSALKEAFNVKASFAAARARIENINPVLAYADTLWICLSREPRYSEQVIIAVTRSVDRALTRMITGMSTAMILGWLEELRSAGAMRRTAELPRVADLISRQLITSVAIWANGEICLQQLRKDLEMGVGLMLLGIAEPSEALRIEAWLSRH
jgi:AcrR family transcriptional regulator